jgi:hypothetical protein
MNSKEIDIQVLLGQYFKLSSKYSHSLSKLWDSFSDFLIQTVLSGVTACVKWSVGRSLGKSEKWLAEADT